MRRLIIPGESEKNMQCLPIFLVEFTLEIRFFNSLHGRKLA